MMLQFTDILYRMRGRGRHAVHPAADQRQRRAGRPHRRRHPLPQARLAHRPGSPAESHHSLPCRQKVKIQFCINSFTTCGPCGRGFEKLSWLVDLLPKQKVALYGVYVVWRIFSCPLLDEQEQLHKTMCNSVIYNRETNSY